MLSSGNISVKSFLISLAICTMACLGYYLNSISKTDGHYVYLIDDAYIHLAIAKNFVLHHVWGITQYQFSSTSSSPLFTYLLGVLIKIFGNNDQIPLYVNIIFGIGILYFLYKHFSEFFKDVRTVPATLFTVFFAVLHVQVLSGMEHAFHVFLFTVNIFCFYQWGKNKYAVFGFYLTLLLMGVVRFESMFYFVILALLFIITKRWKRAVGVLITGFIPIILFCYFNYRHDGFFFPNSVLVKGTKLSLDANLFSQLKVIVLDNFLFNISFYKIGFFPVLLCLVLLCRDFRAKGFLQTVQDDFLLIVLSLLMICHSMFADLKGSFRYEAYILTGFSMVLIPKLIGLLGDLKKEKLVNILVLMNVLLFIYKIGFAHIILNSGGKNIYEQQIQSARFLNTYYNTSKVVANDIGAITYYSDIHLLDIAGLGSKEMIPFNENKKQFDLKFEKFLTQYCNDNKYDIAVIYEDWLHEFVPKNWKKAAILKIQDRVTVARVEVSIYSIDPDNFEQLKQNIRKFRWNKNVQVTIVD